MWGSAGLGPSREGTTGNVTDSGPNLPEDDSCLCHLPAGCDLGQIS